MRLHTVTRACSNNHCTPYTTQNVLLHFCGTLTMVQWCPLVYLLMFREATSFKMGQSYGWLSSNELTLTDWGDTDCFQPTATKHEKTQTVFLLCGMCLFIICFIHDDVISWKHFPRYWPFVRGIHQSPVNPPAQRPVTGSFDVFFDLRLNKPLSKQSLGWWFETLSRPLWCHCNGTFICWMLIVLPQRNPYNIDVRTQVISVQSRTKQK